MSAANLQRRLGENELLFDPYMGAKGLLTRLPHERQGRCQSCCQRLPPRAICVWSYLSLPRPTNQGKLCEPRHFKLA